METPLLDGIRKQAIHPALMGALAGVGVGGTAGALIDKDNRLRGGLIGAGIGGALGGSLGSLKEPKTIEAATKDALNTYKKNFLYTLKNRPHVARKAMEQAAAKVQGLSSKPQPPQTVIDATLDIARGIRKRPLSHVIDAKKWLTEHGLIDLL